MPHPGNRPLTIGEINKMRQMQQKQMHQPKPLPNMHQIKKSNKPNN
jgi:hypothetical protein